MFTVEKRGFWWLLVVVITVDNFNTISGQFYGESCKLPNATGGGTCKYIDECEQVKQDVKLGIRPRICSIVNRRSIVCCPNNNNQIRSNLDETRRISHKKCEEYKNMVVQTVELGGQNQQRIHHISNCGLATGLVIGGIDTTIGEFPHMAAIGWKSFDRFNVLCGGSLISERYVLTAAHCLSRSLRRPYYIRLGAQNVKTKSANDGRVQDFLVKRMIRHENYSKSSAYFDIGLIELNRVVHFTKFIRPACLWQDDVISSSTAVATGWGLTEFAGSSSDQLQKVSLDLLSNQKCNPYFEYIRRFDEGRLNQGIIDTQLCAAAIKDDEIVGGRDTCQGDSGGPLQIKSNETDCLHYIIGLTSFSAVGCGNVGAPGVYTRVSSFLDFIEEIVWP